MTIRRSILLASAQQYGRQGIMFAAGLVVARLLTPAEMGVFAVSMGVAGMLDGLRTMGVPLYFVAIPTLTTQDLRLYAGLNWVLGIGFAALLAAVSGPAAAFYGDAQIGAALCILAGAHVLNPLGMAPGLMLTRDMRFGAMLWIGLAAAVVQAGTVLTLAACGAGPLSLAWAQVAGNLTAAFGNACCVPELARLRPTLQGWRRPFGFGGWMTATGIITNLGAQAGELVIGRTLGLADAALYARASGLAALVRTLFCAAALQPALPAFMQAERDTGADLVAVYLRFVAVITGVGWPACAALAIWAGPVTVLLYGEPWRGAAALLPMLCVATMLSLAVMPHHQALVVRQRVRLLCLCEAGLLGVWLVLLLIAARSGLRAVAWAGVASSFIGAAVFVAVLRQATGVRLRDLGVVWWRSAVPAAAVAAVAAVMRVHPGMAGWPLPLVLMLTGVAGGAAWLGAVWLVRHEFRCHVADLALWGRGRLLAARP